MDQTPFSKSLSKEISLRLTRIETKLARGFEEMGIDITESENWIEINHSFKEIHLKTIGRSIKVILNEMTKKGVKDDGQEYRIYYKDCYFGSLIFAKVV